MEWIQTVLNALTSVEGMTGTLIVVLEFVFRLLPTKKPLSVLRIVASVVKGLAAILSKLSNLLDKILPQNSQDKE
jgi:anaerobic C4-dicarboxylate transporter